MSQFYDKNHTILELESKFSSHHDGVVRHSIDLLLKEGTVEEVSLSNLPDLVGKSHFDYKITTKGMHVYSKLLSPQKEYISPSTSEGYVPPSTSRGYISTSTFADEQKRLKKKDKRCVIMFFTIFAIVFVIFVIIFPLFA